MNDALDTIFEDTQRLNAFAEANGMRVQASRTHSGFAAYLECDGKLMAMAMAGSLPDAIQRLANKLPK